MSDVHLHTIQKRSKGILVADSNGVREFGIILLLKAKYRSRKVIRAIDEQQVHEIIDTGKIKYLIINIRFFNKNIKHYLERIREKCPDIRVLITSTNEDRVSYATLISWKVNGHLSLDCNIEALQNSFTHFIKYGKLDFKDLKLPKEISYNKWSKLSDNEEKIALFLSKGYSLKQSADILGVTSSTVSTLKHRAFVKLGIENIKELMAIVPIHTY